MGSGMIQLRRIFSLSLLGVTLFSIPAAADAIGLGCGGDGQAPEFHITIDMSAGTVTIPSNMVTGSAKTLPATINDTQISWELQYMSGGGGMVIQDFTLDRGTGRLQVFGKIEAARNTTTVEYICKRQEKVL
jgi:hypothetical protein